MHRTTSSSRPLRIASLAVVVPLLVLAGCGGTASSPSQAAATPTPVAATGQPATPAPSAPAGQVTDLAAALQQQYTSIVAKVSPSVVVIQTQGGLGSGIVFDNQGDIVTNAHVVGTYSSFQVTTANGRRLDASLVGTFPADDVAVIKVNATDLPPATFADSSQLAVGDIVLAVGNPLGLQSSVTDGIISALGRTVTEQTGTALPGVIQTSAPINPGNSGGALVDLSGDVVGIPTLAASDPQMGGAAVGIGFAIPSNMVSDIANQFITQGRVVDSHRAYLGVQTADILGGQGVLVYSVSSGGPAAKAGISSDVLIVSINGQSTPDQATLASVLANLSPGQTVTVRIERPDRSTQDIQVTLGELPG
jgi:S1-C subfamily serine protease